MICSVCWRCVGGWGGAFCFPAGTGCISGENVMGVLISERDFRLCCAWDQQPCMTTSTVLPFF